MQNRPEARLLVLHEPQPADPLRRLPEIEVRDQEASPDRRARRQRLAVEPGRHQALATEQVLERQVGRVPAVAVRHEVGRRRLLEARRREQVVDRDPLPDCAELAPLGHAVDVDRDLGPRQRLELFLGPLANERPTVLQGQGPPVERRTWCRPGAQDREVVGHVLAGRDPLLVRFGAPAPSEASGRGHDPLPSRGSGRLRGPPQLSAVFPNINTSLPLQTIVNLVPIAAIVRSFNIRGLDRGQVAREHPTLPEANTSYSLSSRRRERLVGFESSTRPPYRVI